MVIVDVNILITAVHRSAALHGIASSWLSARLGGGEPTGLPWMSLLGFVRIATHPRVFSSPLSPGQAMEVVEAWLAAPSVITPEPTPRHARILAKLLSTAGTASNLTMDAHLAALAIEYQASVATFDRDFLRFDVPVIVPRDEGDARRV